MYLRIPLNADLSQTSFRRYEKIGDVIYIEYCEGVIAEEWEEITLDELKENIPKWFSSHYAEPETLHDPVMEKLNDIEAKIQTNEDLKSFYDDIVKEVGL